MEEAYLRLVKQKYQNLIIPRKKSSNSQEVHTQKKLVLPTDYQFTLRSIAQNKTQNLKAKEQAINDIPNLDATLPNSALDKLNQTLEQIKEAAFNSNQEKILIDLDNNEPLANSIETWIKENLCADSQNSHTVMGNAWFYFQSIIDIQNAENITQTIKELATNSNYFKKSKNEQKEIRENLLQKLQHNFQLSKQQSILVLDLILLYEPLDKDLSKYLKNTNFSKHDYLEQAQLKNKFIKRTCLKYPCSEKEAHLFFNSKVDQKEAEKLSKTILSINKRYRVWKDHKKAIGARLGYQALADLFMLSAPLAMASMGDFNYGLATFLGLTGLAIGARGLSINSSIKLSNHIRKKINKDASAAIFYKEYENLSNRSMGKVYEATEKGKEAAIRTIATITNLPSLALLPLGSLALLMQINFYLGLINLGGFAVTGALSNFYGKKISKSQKETVSEKEANAKRLEQTMKAMQEIRLSPNSIKIEKDLTSKKDRVDDIDKLQKQLFVAMGFSNNAANMGTSFITALTGGILGANPQVLASIFMFTGRILGPLGVGLEKFTKMLSQDIHLVNRLHEIIGNPENIAGPNSIKEKNKISIKEIKNHNIEIKNLSFKNILKNINLKISEGEFITITGPSGIGKSTLLKNILGLLSPDEGDTQIGGISTTNIQKLNPEDSLFNLVSYCDQKPSIIQGFTLRENLLLGLEGVNDEKIVEIMQDLGLYPKDESLIEEDDPTLINKSLDDIIDHDFSGGQKVRIGLARALLRNAKIFLLDEPSASLDKYSSKLVRQLLLKVHRENPDISIICVTHDEKLIEDSKTIGRSIDLGSDINNLETLEGLQELMSKIQPKEPADIKKFLREDLYQKTGIDFYDLRKVLLASINEEKFYYNAFWRNAN